MYEQELIALADAGTHYVVIGAVALGLHNYPRATADLDILPALDSQNLEKLITVLESLGYKPRIPVTAREMLDPKKREAWYRDKHMLVFTFIKDRIPYQVVDVMIYPPVSYEECSQTQKSVYIQGRTIQIASIDQLLRLKQAAMREKDLTDIQILKRLKEIESGGPGDPS